MKRRVSAEQKLAIQNAVARARAAMKAIDVEDREICKVLGCDGEAPIGPKVSPGRFRPSVDDYIDDCINDQGDVDELLAILNVAVTAVSTV